MKTCPIHDAIELDNDKCSSCEALGYLRLFAPKPESEHACKRCGEDDLHVCVPEVVEMLKNDIGFRDLIKELNQENGANNG